MSSYARDSPYERLQRDRGTPRVDTSKGQRYVGGESGGGAGGTYTERGRITSAGRGSTVGESSPSYSGYHSGVEPAGYENKPTYAADGSGMTPTPVVVIQEHGKPNQYMTVEQFQNRYQQEASSYATSIGQKAGYEVTPQQDGTISFARQEPSSYQPAFTITSEREQTTQQQVENIFNPQLYGTGFRVNDFKQTQIDWRTSMDLGFEKRRMEFEEYGRYFRQQEGLGKLTGRERIANIVAVGGTIGLGAFKGAVDVPLHPIQTFKGIIQTTLHPIKSGYELGKSLQMDPLYTTGYLAGQFVALKGISDFTVKNIKVDLQPKSQSWHQVVTDIKYQFKPATLTITPTGGDFKGLVYELSEKPLWQKTDLIVSERGIPFAKDMQSPVYDVVKTGGFETFSKVTGQPSEFQTQLSPKNIDIYTEFTSVEPIKNLVSSTDLTRFGFESTKLPSDLMATFAKRTEFGDYISQIRPEIQLRLQKSLDYSNLGNAFKDFAKGTQQEINTNIFTKMFSSKRGGSFSISKTEMINENLFEKFDTGRSTFKLMPEMDLRSEFKVLGKQKTGFNVISSNVNQMRVSNKMSLLNVSMLKQSPKIDLDIKSALRIKSMVLAKSLVSTDVIQSKKSATRLISIPKFKLDTFTFGGGSNARPGIEPRPRTHELPRTFMAPSFDSYFKPRRKSKKSRRIKSSRGFGYTVSLKENIFNIKGMAPKKFTGLEARPFPIKLKLS